MKGQIDSTNTTITPPALFNALIGIFVSHIYLENHAALDNWGEHEQVLHLIVGKSALECVFVCPYLSRLKAMSMRAEHVAVTIIYVISSLRMLRTLPEQACVRRSQMRLSAQYGEAWRHTRQKEQGKNSLEGTQECMHSSSRGYRQ